LMLQPGYAERENTSDNLLELSESIADLSATASKSTVFIEGLRDKGEGRGTGSGFVVDAMRGIVVTNAHVVGDHDSFLIRFFDGRETNGNVLGRDPQTDLAVIKIPGSTARFEIPWGDSDELRPGNLVMAIGSPLGLKGTTSLGVVSALHRNLHLVEDSYEDFIQHDAFIDHGSSGGPLLNMRGEVVGINTAIGGSGQHDAWAGISYSIPTQIARRYVDDIADGGEIRRGYLGLSGDTLDANGAKLRGLNHTYGVLITSVIKDGPAAVAGLQEKDVILEINGREVASSSELKARVAAVAPGSSLEFKIWRRRQIIEKVVKIGVKP
ncbi:MAG: trypsin-like peptidase domain-containing protein, partial [Planctomycetota bacterium]|nr:trypsin-like peptidase domain-containing protein [Planctomycetota bacterium]